jgi:hypothetical protein
MQLKTGEIKVLFAVDCLGDHQAFPLDRLIDVEEENFKDLNEALIFANKCTQCLNEKDLLQLAGLSGYRSRVSEIVLGTVEQIEEDEVVHQPDYNYVY